VGPFRKEKSQIIFIKLMNLGDEIKYLKR